MMNGWLWIVAELVLARVGNSLPIWFFLGAAIAVGLMGLALLIGIWTGGLPLALVVTALLTGAAWLALRRIFGTNRGEVRRWTRDINDN